MPKLPQERYQPGNLPETLPGLLSFLYDELWRIARALNAFPIGMNVREDAIAVPVDTTPTEHRLFENVTPTLDLPGGNFNEPLGEWTAPASGIYQVNVNSVVDPFGAGNKDYAAKLRIYIDDIEAWSNTDVGDDAYTLSCSMAISGLLERGEVIRFTLELVHEQFTGNTTVTSFMSISATAIQ